MVPMNSAPPQPVTPELLRRQFSQADFLTFTSVNGLIRIEVKAPAAIATLFLQGAHLAAWQPTGQQPAIFFSPKSDLTPGKPFRGGIPIIFPWFAGDPNPTRIDGHPGPSHGFARIEDWALTSAAHKPPHVALTFTLGPTDLSRRLGFDAFRLTLTFLIGPTLTVSLTVHNPGPQPLLFEEGFHTYFRVASIHETTITGLENTPYLDKTDRGVLKPPSHAPIAFTAKVDRVYNDTQSSCTIDDVPAARNILLSKTGSASTVVFNPFAPLADLGEWDWHNMVALEATNVGANALTLAPGAAHTLAMTITLQPSTPAAHSLPDTA